MIGWLSSLWRRLRGRLRRAPIEDVDAEVREIFVSELEEIGETLTRLLPAWQQQRRHAPTLQEIRRGFHTLKGSARLVGEESLAAFCGSIEKQALDLIERPNAAAPGALAAIDAAIDLLPECARAMRAGRALPAALRG